MGSEEDSGGNSIMNVYIWNISSTNTLSVIVRVTGALNLWGGGVSQTTRNFFPSKNMETYHEIPMINSYEKTEKVTLVNPFRPPHKKLPYRAYTALFYRTMTLKSQSSISCLDV